MKIGIIGLGEMAEAILRGLLKSPDLKLNIQATTASLGSAAAAKKKFKRHKINVHADNAKLADECRVILLCVKPYLVRSVLETIAPRLKKTTSLISVAAGISTDQMNLWSGGASPCIRTMPNTPCLVGEGMTVICAGPGVKPTQLKLAQKIFASVGKVLVAPEEQMDAVTGLSGSGPAYVYAVIEGLMEGGRRAGLSEEVSRLLAAQTLLGAAKMVLETGKDPVALKQSVATPGGCTVEGLAALEKGQLCDTLARAVIASSEKSKRLRTSS